MLAAYLNEAKNVVQMKQVGPGRPVHVRLSRDSNGIKKRSGGDERSSTVTSSYAVWAVTGA